MTTTTFPNGMTLVSSALNTSVIDQLLQNLACQILGINPGVATLTTLTAGSTTATVASNASIAAAQTVTGSTFLPAGVTVASITSNTVTLSAPATGSATTMLAFGADANAYYNVRVGWQQTGQPAFLITDDICTITATLSDDDYNRIRNTIYSPNDVESLTQTTCYTRVWRIAFSLYGPNSFDHARLLKSAMFMGWAHDILGQNELYLVTNVSDPRRIPELADGQWWERSDFSVRLNELVTETITAAVIASAEVIVKATGNAAMGYGLGGYGDGGYGGSNFGTFTALDITIGD
jgi:hypothetical protein